MMYRKFVDKNDEDYRHKALYRKGKISNLGALIKRVVGNHSRKYGFSEASIIMNWDIIVGSELGKMSRPCKVVHENNENILHVHAYSGGVAIQIIHNVSSIISNIIIHCGYKAISQVKVLQTQRDL